MEEGAGIYRTGDSMQSTCNKLSELRDRFSQVKLDDTSSVYNTELFLAIELEAMLETGKDMSTKYKETAKGGLAVCAVCC